VSADPGLSMTWPRIIQGGMGAGVSDWRLAGAVARTGQLGVVSGTALATVLSRRLQMGDPGEDCRRALAQFPVPAMTRRILADHFIPGGKGPTTPFRLQPLPTLDPPAALVELTVAANFAEVYLAKEGHAGPVGINLLEKIQLPTLPSLFGAMLAGVDFVLMGAGIPRLIPGVLDRFARGEAAELRIDVEDAREQDVFVSRFDPAAFFGGPPPPPLKRPRFLPIVASAVLAMTLARKSNGAVDGFVVEGETAGGHNAPPRGAPQLSAEGEPVYGPRDVVDLAKIRELGLPFWLAGAYGRPGRLRDALALGATGIQVGTAFAFCAESGIRPDLRREVVASSLAGTARVFTDPLASPTGFPFKVVRAPGTLADPTTYARRERICDLGYLRRPYVSENGTVGYRCPAEPVDDLIRKRGCPSEADGRKCVCNGLIATVGLAQLRPGAGEEPALITAGNDVDRLEVFARADGTEYTAADVVRVLLGDDPGS
jgi:nitronate monooxygenase